MMHEGDHHLIAKHKALLSTFEDENDDNSELKIDVGVDSEDGVEITVPRVSVMWNLVKTIRFNTIGKI
jgi:hypothetical protein